MNRSTTYSINKGKSSTYYLLTSFDNIDIMSSVGTKYKKYLIKIQKIDTKRGSNASNVQDHDSSSLVNLSSSMLETRVESCHSDVMQ